MIENLISILLLSWNRPRELYSTLESNLSKIDHAYEILICDQGSEDSGIIKYLESKNPVYFRRNSRNEGIGKSFNQLFLRSNGSHIALMSNDIAWPNRWGSEMVSWLNKVPDSGICGFEWWDWLMPPLSTKFDLQAHWLSGDKNRVYGPIMFRREVVEKIGLFPEQYGPYGEEFSFNERVNRAWFNSFYIPGKKALHIANDVGEQTEYRKMKDESAAKNIALYYEQVKQWDLGASIKEPLPEMRKPL